MIDEKDEPVTQPSRLFVREGARLRSGQREYPWDVWCRRARAAGVGVELAELGRAVMREAEQHLWSPALHAECGWLDGGEAMIARALAEPIAAQARWRYLLDTDGAED